MRNSDSQMKIAILGAAESGVGAAILAQQKGYDVFVSDMGNIKDNYKEMLNAHGLAWEEGKHTEERILDATEVIKSPGIPDTAPMVQKIIVAGIPIISEIEFAARYTAAKMLCITGSNGKTTTTSLIYHIMKHAGMNVGLAGNIGHSLALQGLVRYRTFFVPIRQHVFFPRQHCRTSKYHSRPLRPLRLLHAELCRF